MSNSSTLPVCALLPSEIESATRQRLQESIVDFWGDVSPAMLLLPALQPKGTLEFILRNQDYKGTWGDPEGEGILLIAAQCKFP
ncbi:MAG: hypothetical protein HC862_29830 [Scytonema sp. RU_4_4]|nr:hypothetical protein [Scytonema sp. RU_4_4]